MASLSSLILLVYFTLIRPAREIMATELVFPIVFQSETAIGNAYSVYLESRSVIYSYAYQATEATSFYMPQFGLFFLLALIGLLLYRRGAIYYGFLAGFHAVVELLVLLLIAVGIHVSISGFILSDFLIRYLSPLISLGFVVYASLAARRERAG